MPTTPAAELVLHLPGMLGRVSVRNSARQAGFP